jgi:hypothetical protein
MAYWEADSYNWILEGLATPIFSVTTEVEQRTSSFPERQFLPFQHSVIGTTPYN